LGHLFLCLLFILLLLKFEKNFSWGILLPGGLFYAAAIAEFAVRLCQEDRSNSGLDFSWCAGASH
jgi:hypothetical protein